MHGVDNFWAGYVAIFSVVGVVVAATAGTSFTGLSNGISAEGCRTRFACAFVFPPLLKFQLKALAGTRRTPSNVGVMV